MIMSTTLLYACSPNLFVKYRTNPLGGTTYAKNAECFMYGIEEVCKYPVTKDQIKQGFIKVPGAKAQWASGAVTEENNIKFNLTEDVSFFTDPKKYEATYLFNRPHNYPNLNVDLKNEVKYKLRLQRIMERY